MANPDHSAEVNWSARWSLESAARSLDDWEAWVAESTAALLLRDAEADV